MSCSKIDVITNVECRNGFEHGATRDFGSGATGQTVAEIVGSNGNIVYDGCVTDFARNRTMKGQLGISITFTYPLIQNEYLGINLPSGS